MDKWVFPLRQWKLGSLNFLGKIGRKMGRETTLRYANIPFLVTKDRLQRRKLSTGGPILRLGLRRRCKGEGEREMRERSWDTAVARWGRWRRGGAESWGRKREPKVRVSRLKTLTFVFYSGPLIFFYHLFMSVDLLFFFFCADLSFVFFLLSCAWHAFIFGLNFNWIFILFKVKKKKF